MQPLVQKAVRVLWHFLWTVSGQVKCTFIEGDLLIWIISVFAAPGIRTERMLQHKTMQAHIPLAVGGDVIPLPRSSGKGQHVLKTEQECPQ